MTDRWEQGFDSWTPRGRPVRDDDTAFDLDREALLHLARELADRRRAEREQTDPELEQLKQTLRERAEAIAIRERELAQLEKRAGGAKAPERPSVDAEALVSRERAALERAQALDERERVLQLRAAELESEADELASREQALEAELARARSQLAESQSERELANAERALLELRAEETRQVEKALAARRIELEAERDRLEARAAELEAQVQALSEPPAPEPALAPAPDPQLVERERELQRLEATLEERERELALVRQGIDAERNALAERERALRRREIAEVRQSFDEPLTPPRFSDGLAAFVSARGRR